MIQLKALKNTSLSRINPQSRKKQILFLHKLNCFTQDVSYFNVKSVFMQWRFPVSTSHMCNLHIGPRLTCRPLEISPLKSPLLVNCLKSHTADESESRLQASNSAQASFCTNIWDAEWAGEGDGVDITAYKFISPCRPLWPLMSSHHKGWMTPELKTQMQLFCRGDSEMNRFN